MGTGKRIALLFGAFALTVALAYLLASYNEHRQVEQLRDGAGEIQRAVERYAVDTEGVYPRELGQLFERGYLTDLPDSPYGGKVKLLGLNEPAEPGGVHYIPFGPIIAIGDIDADRDGDPTVPTEIDQYTLVIYQDKPHRERGLPQWCSEELYSSHYGNGLPWATVDGNIDRSRIVALLTAGQGCTCDK